VFCRQHALAHHVDVSNRRCQVAGCEARALYGEANGSKALRCTQVCLSGVFFYFFSFFVPFSVRRQARGPKALGCTPAFKSSFACA